jgi:hypothetical protein
MVNTGLTKQDVEAALTQLNELAESEYGQSLEKLLEDPKGEQRLRRLAGVVLKRPFAEREERRSASDNPTDARYAWDWDEQRFNDASLQKTEEYDLLVKLRDAHGGSWGALTHVADDEVGLFYVLGKWIKGKVTNEGKTFRDYYYETKSPEVEAALSLVDQVFNLTPFLAGFLGVPALTVSVALIAVKYGYEKVTDPPQTPDRAKPPQSE